MADNEFDQILGMFLLSLKYPLVCLTAATPLPETVSLIYTSLNAYVLNRIETNY